MPKVHQEIQEPEPGDSFPIIGFMGGKVAEGHVGELDAEIVYGMDGIWVNFDDEYETSVLLDWNDLLKEAHEFVEDDLPPQPPTAGFTRIP